MACILQKPVDQSTEQPWILSSRFFSLISGPFTVLVIPLKKAPRHGEEPDTSFPLCACVLRVLLNRRSPLFQLSTFTDTVVRLSLFAALISRMPSR